MSVEANPSRPPWEELSELLRLQDVPAVRSFLSELSPTDAPRVLDRLSPEEHAQLLILAGPEEGAAIIELVSEPRAVEMLESLAPPQAAAILEALPSDAQADLLQEIEPEEAEAILAEMTPDEAREAAELARYPADTAGGLMHTEFIAYPESSSVADVIDDLRRNRDQYEGYNVLYVYVVTSAEALSGVLRLRNLLISPETARLHEMAAPPISVDVTASLDELEALFDRHGFLAFPVVAENGRLVGVVQRTAVEEALAERADDQYRASQGIVLGEEVRSMPVLVRSGRRLSWLSVNIVLNVIAASVIAFFQDTLAAVIALALFLPIISDMSGCSGNQAVAVSVREIALGLITPADLFRVWRQEVLVGLLNGLALGSLLAGVAWAWQGNPVLGLVVGASLAVNTLVAVSMGGLLPLLLKRMGRDPAIASGPILTTVTDMCGFLLVLGLATLLLSHLA